MQSFRDLKLSHPEQDDNQKKTTLISRNITVCGRRTSIRLEPEMWRALRDIAKREKCTIHEICSLVSMCKNANTSLTAAIRVFLMLYFRAASTEEGHMRAAHGDLKLMIERARIPKDSTKEFKVQIPPSKMPLRNMEQGHDQQAAYQELRP